MSLDLKESLISQGLSGTEPCGTLPRRGERP